MPAPMEFIERPATGAVVFSLSGRLDSGNAPDVEDRLVPRVEQAGRKPIVIDLSDLTYIASAGLRVFLMAVKRARVAGTGVHLANPSEGVLAVLDMSGFTTLFDLHDTLEDALEDVDASLR